MAGSNNNKNPAPEDPGAGFLVQFKLPQSYLFPVPSQEGPIRTESNGTQRMGIGTFDMSQLMVYNRVAAMHGKQ